MENGVSMYSYVELVQSKNYSQADFFAQVSREKIKAVEILDCFWENPKENIDNIEESIKESQSHNLRIACFSIGNDFVIRDRKKWNKQVEYVKWGIETAACLGAPVLRVFGGSAKEGITYEQAKPWIIEGFRKVAKTAEKEGVTMAMENHGQFSGKISQIREILKGVDSKNMRACLDTGNFFGSDEDPTEAVKMLAQDTAHVHLKDVKVFNKVVEGSYSSILGKGIKAVPLGEGAVDFVTIFNCLKDAGYKGVLSLEYEARNYPVIEYVSKSIVYIKKILKGLKRT